MEYSAYDYTKYGLYGTAACAGVVATLPLWGFTASGVAAGSVAAGWQATIGNVAAGSVFSLFQHFGATMGMNAILTAGAAGGAAGTMDYFDKKKKCDQNFEPKEEL